MAEDKKIISLLGEIVTLLKPIAQNLLPKIVDSRFTDNGNGTISDKKTALIWDKDGSQSTMTFNEAEKYCEDLSEKTGEQWRLPTVEELFSLVDYTKKDPAINSVFGCKPNYYWTSTPYAVDSDCAWVVVFSFGHVGWYYRSGDNYVRPVRQS